MIVAPHLRGDDVCELGDDLHVATRVLRRPHCRGSRAIRRANLRLRLSFLANYIQNNG
jgi:hypothetical protein